MIKKYNQFILERNNIEQTNEGLKDWVAAFMMLANVGVVPLTITTANAQTKKDFVEKQPQDKIDAAKFVDYINKFGGSNPVNKIWDEFILKNKDVKSQYKDVEKYINKDGKTYHFDKKFQQQDFSNVDIHKFTPSNYLTDIGGFIDDSQEPSINNFIYDYGKETSVEVCVITVPSLDGEDPFQYSLDQFNRIGVGKEPSDNGILIMVSMADRKWEIRTGYGVEGLLPDITCHQIGEEVIVPHFKKKDFYGGIMGALQEIKKNIDRNPDDIKKMKADQDAKSSAEFKETMSDIGYGALLLTIITALTVMVYRKWKKNEELVDDIESRLEIAEKINKYYILRNSAKNSGVDELDELFNKFKKIVDDNVLSVKKSSEPVSKPKFYEFGKQDKFIQEQELRAQTLEDIYGDITKVYKIWRDKKERLDNVKSVISGLSIVGILSSIEDGYRAWTELSNIYGVNTGYDKELLKSKATELSGLVSKAENAYKTSIADAENILSKYGPKEKGISREVSNIRSILSQYQTTDRQLKNWKSILDQSIASMMVYKNWAESGEDKVAQNAVAKFTNIIKNGYDKKNMDPMAAELRKALDSIESVQDKWRGRKEEEDEIERKRQEEIERKKRKKREEEEAERRRKRREEEEEEDRRRSSYSSSSSSYSSSSSDSGSSFGGFGGGDSGGGGSGGSW